MKALVVGCALLALAGVARAAPVDRAETRRFAIVIGNNQAPHDGLARLRYADDDAVRWALLLDALGSDVEVLTTLDDESARLYRPLSFQPQPPTHQALRDAVSRLAGRVAAARAAGAATVFYFVYAGHGDVEDGRGYLALADGRFTRAELADEVLGPLGSGTNHVIIDACRASSFMGDRGPGGERRPWQGAYFAPNAPALPHTGFLLASSSNGLSHEWEEFQAGVFSHEVRSGLLGAADANADGVVTYGEVAAFVRLANLPVSNARYRPLVVSRPPEGADGVLVDLRGARAGSLTFEPSAPAPAHEVVEDRAGVRWADFHPGTGARVRLILPRAAWSADGFYLRSLAEDVEYAIPAARDVRVADLEPRPSHAARRGALTDAFTHLFELPFDQAALERVELDPELRVEAATPGTDLSLGRFARPASVAIGIAGGASLAVAGGFALAAWKARDDADAASGADRVQYNEQIDTRNRWTTVAGVAGGVLVAASVGLWLWARHEREAALSLW